MLSLRLSRFLGIGLLALLASSSAGNNRSFPMPSDEYPYAKDEKHDYDDDDGEDDMRRGEVGFRR